WRSWPRARPAIVIRRSIVCLALLGFGIRNPLASQKIIGKRAVSKKWHFVILHDDQHLLDGQIFEQSRTEQEFFPVFEFFRHRVAPLESIRRYFAVDIVPSIRECYQSC